LPSKRGVDDGNQKGGSLLQPAQESHNYIPHFTRLPIARMGVLLYKKVGESKRRHKKGKIEDLTP